MILELKDIRARFPNLSGEYSNILDGVSLDVPEGEITAIIGGNGTGKTTLFNIISGFIPTYDGDVVFNNQSIKNYPAYRIASMGIGRLFQGRQLMAGLSVLDNMKLAGSNRFGENPIEALFHPKTVRKAESENEEKAIKVLTDFFGADNKYLSILHEPVETLSYGEQRLLAIVRLLMRDYKLLLLDEPTSGVNQKHIESIKGVIRKMVKSAGKTVLLIEHNMSFVKDLADHCAYLEDGKILRSGAPSDVLKDEHVKNSYLGL